MSGDATLLSALVAELQADATLVSLTEHTITDQRILRGGPPKPEKLPFLGVHITVSFPLNKDTTFIKKNIVSICGYGKQEIKSIQISDRVEELFHNLGGDTNGYYDFTSSNIRIYSTRFVARRPHKFDNDSDRWEDEVVVEIVSNNYDGCE